MEYRFEWIIENFAVERGKNGRLPNYRNLHKLLLKSHKKQPSVYIHSGNTLTMIIKQPSAPKQQ